MPDGSIMKDSDMDKKEKTKEGFKKENNFIYAAKQAKKDGEKTFTIGGKTYDVEEALKTETNKNDKSDDGDGMDAVQPKAVKKKFKDRKDKDIDNDGDVDSSDKFLHKRRKAISKSMKETIRDMWTEAAKKESQDLEHDKDGDGKDDDGKPSKTKGKTATGKDMTKVDTDPKMPKVKEHKMPIG